MKTNKKILTLALLTFSGLCFAQSQSISESRMTNQLKNQEIMINTDLNDLSKKTSLKEITETAKAKRDLKEKNEKKVKSELK